MHTHSRVHKLSALLIIVSLLLNSSLPQASAQTVTDTYLPIIQQGGQPSGTAPTATGTATNIATNDEVQTATSTATVSPLPSATSTTEPVEVATSTPADTATAASTDTPDHTATAAPTDIPADTATIAPTDTPADTATAAPTDTATPTETATNTPTPDNDEPELDPIGNQTVAVGNVLRLTLAASDGDGEPVMFFVAPLPLPDHAMLDQTAGTFEFAPDTSQIGTLEITFIARDSKGGEGRETVTITIQGPPANQSTTLRGRVLDTNAFTRSSRAEIAITGATISFLNTDIITVTDSAGYFTLHDIPPGPQVLDIDTSTADPAPDGSPYAGFREKIELLEGVENVVQRPFFLPRIDQSSLTTVDPAETTTVDNPNLDISMNVVPFSAQDQEGRDFAGELSISEVPDALAPAALPEELDPGLLITIQPVGVTFDPPAPVVFPNTDDLPPGTEVDIWSLDPDEGIFVVVAQARVSADGERIETISGGIRAADWHMALPPNPDNDDNDNNDDNQDEDKCCKQNSGSDTDISGGSLTINHELVSYQSLGQARNVNLIYNSLRADPQPIINSNLTIPRRAAIPNTISARLTVGGVDQGVETHWSTNGLSESVDETARVATQFDASNFDTGLYPYRLILASNYAQSSVASSQAGRTLVYNKKNSPFGAGWGIDGLQRLVELDSGDMLLTDGDGSATLFLRQRAPEELIAAIAEQGTPADPQQASANVGQVISLFSDQPIFDENSTVTFTTLSDTGELGTRTVQVVAVSETADAVAVIVPQDATSGPVFAEVGRDVFLQIVPIVSGYQNSDFRPDARLSLEGQGFAEGAITVNFGPVSVADTEVNSGINVSSNNSRLDISIPADASGVISVATVGGSSEPLIVGPATFTGVQTVAAQGTAADGDQPSANVGQLITLFGIGLGANTNVIFTSINDNDGTPTTVAARVDSIAADNTSATVVVPQGATSGNITVVGATGQAPLQIVPVLTTSSNVDFRPSGTSRRLRLSGTGFAEGSMTVHFGDTDVVDPDAGNTLLDVFSSGTNLDVVIPDTPHGIVSVTTAGGSSNNLVVGPTTFTGVQATANSGTPTDNEQPSANIGQAITILGENLGPNTNVFFPTLDDNSVAGSISIRVSYVSADGTSATVTVPNGAVTGDITIYGAEGSAALQIVPHLLSFSNRDYRPSGSSRTLQLNGGGFMEGMISVHFGGETIEDPDPGTNQLDVFSTGRSLSVVIPPNARGVVSVMTAGGSSNDLIVGPMTFTRIQAAARQGTPANAGQPSANLGQSITILGTNLGTNTNVLFTTQDDSGVPGTTSVGVSYVAADGTSANVTVPNGAISGDISIHGAPGSISLQIVPALTSFSNTDFRPSGTSRTLDLSGGGFVEGSITVHFGEETVSDPDTGTNLLDVFSGNSRLSVIIPVDAEGVVSVTTAGGSSNAVTVGPIMLTGVQARADVGTPANAAQPSANPGQTIVISGTGLGVNTNVNFPTMSDDGILGSTNVRVKSITPDGLSATVVVPNGATTGDLTLQGTTGSAALQIVPRINSFSLSSFTAGRNLGLNGGGFVEGTSTIQFGAVSVADPDTGSNIVDIRSSGTALNVTIPDGAETTVSVVTAGGTSNGVDMDVPTVAIRIPQLGEEVVENSTIPIRVSGIDNGPLEPVEFLINNTVQFTDTRAPYEFAYTVPAFAPAGDNIVRLNARATDSDGNTTTSAEITITVVQATLAIEATANVGTPANAGQPSANPGQLIVVRGPGLTSDTEMIFLTANSEGVASSTTVRVSNVTPDGRSATVLVPDSAATGDVQINGTSAGTRLQIVPRLISFSNSDFRASGTAATMRLNGQGFVEGEMTVNYGDASVVDPDGSPTTIDVFSSGRALNSVIPEGATSSVTVVTSGGTSNALLVGPDSYTDTLATARVGEPIDPELLSANIGQPITLLGMNFTLNTNVIFSSIDNDGVAGTIPVRVSGVSADGTIATVIVPNGAATGDVSIFGVSGLFSLQIVPRLNTFTNSDFRPSGLSRNLDLQGSGFIEGEMTVHFGATNVVDPDTGSNDIDVYSSGTRFNTVIPDGVGSVISVTTAGGTSNSLVVGPTSFLAIETTAQRGTPATLGEPSANVGQAITLRGSGFKPNTNVLFPTVDTEGVAGNVSVRVNSVSATGDLVTVLVPNSVATGDIEIHGINVKQPLQIVPRLNSFSNSDFAPSGQSRNLGLIGGGFVEGMSTVHFGAVSVDDPDTGPNSVDVFSSGTRLNTIIPDGASGVISITTAGGSSNELTVGPIALISAEATTLVGAAADESQPSANVGQLITLRGVGLGRNTNVIFPSSDNNGVAGNAIVRVRGANADGTVATVLIPDGVKTGDMFVAGVPDPFFLQIVPRIGSFSLSDLTPGNNLRLNGSGFVEGDMTVRFGNTLVADPDTGPNTLDVFFSGSALNVTVPDNPGANIRAVTAGGVSNLVDVAPVAEDLIAPAPVPVIDPSSDPRDFRSPDGNFHTLLENNDGTFTYVMKDGMRYNFSAEGLQTAHIERNGNTTTYGYNGQGRLTKMADPVGQETTFAYQQGRLSRIVDPAGRETAFSHDAQGNLIQITDPDESMRQFSYDDRHRMASQTSKRDFVTQYEYNFAGRHVKSVWPDGSTREVSPTQMIGLVDPASGLGTRANPAPLVRPADVQGSYTDGNGQQTVFNTDRFGSTAANVDALGRRKSIPRDDDSNADRIVYPDGDCVEFSYDTVGNLLTETRMPASQCGLPPASRDPALLQHREYTYETRFNQVKTDTDARGNMTTYVYDYEEDLGEAGNLIRIEYPAVPDEDGNVVNPTVRFTYNEYSQVRTVTDQRGMVTEYVYTQGIVDEASDGSGPIFAEGVTPMAGMLTRIIEDAGAGRLNLTTIYRSFDEQGRPQEEIEPNGAATRLHYDALGRVVSATDAVGIVTQLEYDDRGNLVRQVDDYTADGESGRNVVTDYIYDNLNRLLTERVAADDITYEMSRSYDANGNLIAETDGRGNRTTYTYDGANQRIAHTDPLGHTTTYSYTAKGQVAGMILPDGSISHYHYDAYGNRVEAVDDVGGLNLTTRSSYDLNDNPIQIIAADGTVTCFEYDVLNRVTATVEDCGVLNLRTTHTLDLNGNIVTVVDERGVVTVNEYDAVNRHTLQRRDDGGLNLITRQTYDANGNRTSMVDERDVETTFTYDLLDRLEKICEDATGLNLCTTHTYDSLDNLLTETDPNGVTTRTENNVFGLPRQVVEDDGGINATTIYEYDNTFNLVGLTDANGNANRYTYTSRNELATVDFADGTALAYGYDARGSQIRRVNQDDSTITYTYDGAARVRAANFSTGGSRTLDYDELGRLTLAEQTMHSHTTSLTFAYNALGDIISTTQTLDEQHWPVAYDYDYITGTMTTLYPSGVQRTLTLDPLDRLTSVIGDGDASIAAYDYQDRDSHFTITYGNTIANRIDYDALFRTSRVSSAVADYRYGYDGASNRTFMQRAHLTEQPTDVYRYNNLYQLTEVSYGADATTPAAISQFTRRTRFDLDPLGNRLMVERDSAPGSATESTTNVYMPNDGSQLTNVMNRYELVDDVALGYDDRGNLLGDGVNTYTYDILNQQITMSNSDGSAEYIYDALGRRIAKVLGETTAHYIYDFFYRVLEERTEVVDSSDSPSDDLLARYTYGKSIVEVLTMERDDVTYYFHRDAQGSVTEVTDSAGVLMERYEYDVYGTPHIFDGSGVALAQSGIGNPYLFTGHYYDSESGNYYARARFYSPTLGRFLQMDPLGYLDGLNLYAYSQSNPTSRTDPTGFFSALDCASGLIQGLGSGAWDFFSGLAGLAWNLATSPIDTVSGIMEGIGGLVSEIISGNLEKAASQLFPRLHKLATQWECLDDKEKCQLIGEIIGEYGAGILTGVGAAKLLKKLKKLKKRLPCSSFMPDTLVTTIDGLVPIEELEVGDYVLAFNEKTGEVGYYPVTATRSKIHSLLIELTIDGETVVTTPEHPFYVMASAPWLAMGQMDGRWVNAGELAVGDDVRRANGLTGDVELLAVVPVQQQMYNLTVDVAHTFFVGQQGWLVHNCGPLRGAAATQAAKKLGYNQRIPPQRVPFNSHGQPAFYNKKTYITPDIDGHIGGVWKKFDRRGNRLGTYDANLNRIGD